MQKTSTLMVRSDEESKALLASAAEFRQVSVSDYVRSIVVGQAKRELVAAQSQTIAMTDRRTTRRHFIFWRYTESCSDPRRTCHRFYS